MRPDYIGIGYLNSVMRPDYIEIGYLNSVMRPDYIGIGYLNIVRGVCLDILAVIYIINWISSIEL